jgi:hypothetical protein
MKIKRTQTTVETHQVLYVRRNSPPYAYQLDWCEECVGPSQWISPDDAAAVRGTSSRMIYRWIEMKQVHFRETPDGSVWLCCNSIVLGPSEQS